LLFPNQVLFIDIGEVLAPFLEIGWCGLTRFCERVILKTDLPHPLFLILPSGKVAYMTAHNETLNSPNPPAGPKMVQDLGRWYDRARLFGIEALEALQFLLEKGVKKSWERVKEEFQFLYKKLTTVDYILGNLSLAAMAFAGLLMLFGFGILGYQSVLWLQNGVWDPMPMMLVFNFLFEGTALHGWMLAPGSWLGLHQLTEWVLANTPISLVLVLSGLLLGVATAGVSAFALLVRRFQLKLTEK